MKNSRPRIKYSQTPHSISRRIETISNKTAAALLSLINRKTVGFGVGYVDLPYRQISKELGVGPRAIQRAAQRLEEWGDIIRERVAYRIYRWRVVLERDEVIEDPQHTYTTKDGAKGAQVLIERSGPCGSNDPDHADRTIRTQEVAIEQHKAPECDDSEPLCEQKNPSLKNSFKDTDLKKQQQSTVDKEASSPNPIEPNSQPAVSTSVPLDGKNDDEPLHKYCLKSLRKYGVSQRMARKLCRENENELIKEVLDTVPQLAGVENLAGYLVAAIRDGGYKLDKKNGRQVSDDRSNYAHLTGLNIKANRHKTVKENPTVDAPIAYRTVEETRTEQQALETQKLEQEQKYQKTSQQLAERFKKLSQDLQLRLKLIASVHLSKLVPVSGKREEALRDKTFRRMANRAVLEQFFEWVDQGLDEAQALQRLETPVAA